MAGRLENFRQPFVNPYVDERSNEARFSTIVTLDEAQERWRKGAWQANADDFKLSPSFLDDEREPLRVKVRQIDASQAGKEEKKSENRFAFDLQRDIIYGDELYSDLDETAYTDSYRPRGDIGSNISNITLDRLRYNALADIKEDLPEDLSYLYGTGTDRHARVKAKTKDRLYNRLDTPVDKRRAKVDQMIPQKRGESPEMIMADVKRRREIEDAKSGIVRKPEVKQHLGIYDIPTEPGTVEDFTDYDGQDEYDIERVTGRGSWRGNIPTQDGLVPDSRAVPYFGRFSRSWSKMDSLDPTRTEMLRHTVNTIYDDGDDDERPTHRKFRPNGSSRREYYVSDMDFDPDDRYRRLNRQRKRVSAGKNVLSESIMSGEFNNPYVQTDNDRLKSIINHDLRGPGQSAEPEGLTDPALIYEWNMGYSRVNTDENKYSQWLRQQSTLAEQAEQSRYRGTHRTGRPGAYLQRERPYGEERRYPRGQYNGREEHRRDMQAQMQRATEQGMADGREMIRLQQRAERRTQQEQLRKQRVQQNAARKRQEKYQKQQQEQLIRQQQEFYKKQQEQAMKQQQEYYKRQQEYYRRQQEYYQKQQAQGGAQNPAAAPYQQAAQINPQQAAQGRYPQMNPQQAAQQGRYPQMNPQQAAQQGRYPQQGYYPQAAGAQGGSRKS